MRRAHLPDLARVHGRGFLVAVVLTSAILWVAAPPAAAADAASGVVNRPGAELVSADGTTLGTLRVGTALEVLGGDGEAVEVVLHGWSWAAGPALVFAGLGERISLATLSEAGQALRTAADPVNDAFGVPWQEISVRGLVVGADVSPDTSEVWALAAHVLNTKCSVCHSVPVANKYPVYRWPDRVAACAGRQRASLRPAELELLVQYLQYGTERR